MMHDSYNLENLKRRLEILNKFVQPYSWIIDAYVSDFFRLSHAERLPADWWQSLSSCPPPQLATLLSLSTWNVSSVWPLSLLCFRVIVHSHGLPRFPDRDWEEDESSSQEPVRALEHCYRRHVKPKKQHEILRMAKSLHEVCTASDSQHVVDVGAGQGHLSRLLAFGYGLHVTTIEAAGSHAPKAVKFDHEVKRDINLGRVGKVRKRKQKHKQQNSSKSTSTIDPNTLQEPLHVVAWIDPDCSTDEFLEKLRLKGSDFNDREPRNADLDHNCDKQTNKQTQDGRNSVVTTNKSETSSPETKRQMKERNETEAKDLDVDDKEMSSDLITDRNQTDTNALIDSDMGENDSSQILEAGDNLQSVSVIKAQKDMKCGHKEEVDDKLEAKDMYVSKGGGDRAKSEGDSGENNDHNITLPNVKAMVTEAETSTETSAETTQATQTSIDTAPETSTESTASEESSSEAPRFVLTGLHACGDLSVTMLRVFARCPQAVALASVGCCYMKSRSDEDSYPLSQYVNSLPHQRLSYEAREMACHFIDTYHARLIANEPGLITHAYRAALQEIIYEKNPAIQHGQIRLNIKHIESFTFPQYAAAALPRLFLDPELTPDQLTRAADRTARWREAVAFYTLRLALAPLVESLILMDRVLFLRENGIASRLVPIFDPKISPRNFILIAEKVPS